MNSRERLPEISHVFFIDRCLGKKQIAAILRNAGWQVEIHDDHFSPGAEDRVWLREVGERGWIVLTKDQHIRYRETELKALIAANARAFVLTGGSLQGHEMAEAFKNAYPKMIRCIEKYPGPFIARVTKSGSISTVYLLSPQA